MQYRPLGRTGVQVSPLCLGAMMFGPWGNDDEADSIRIIHRALDAGINFVDTADVYSAGVSEEIVGKALTGRRDDVVLATKFFMPMGDDPNHRGGSRRWIMREVENSLRRLRHRLHRPLPGPPAQPGHRRRGDPRRPHRPRPPGQGPLHRLVVLRRQPDRRGPVGLPRPPPGTVRHRAAAVLDPGARHRGRRAAHRPAPRHGHPDLQPAGRRVAVRPVAQGQRRRRRRRRPGPSARFDMTSPANQRKLDIVEEPRPAGRAGRHDADRAGDRVRHQPPGRHRRDHRPPHHGTTRVPASGADITLTTDMLDRIDELVAPGVTVNPDDNSYGEAELTAAARRRSH